MPNGDDLEFLCLFTADPEDIEIAMLSVEEVGGTEAEAIPGRVMSALNRSDLPRAHARVGKVWRKSETKAGQVPGPLVLRVAFLDGFAALRQETMRLAQEWCGPGRADVTFQVVERVEDSDIRVTFNTTANWSLLGSDANVASHRRIATMHLGDADIAAGGGPSSRMARVVRHEFGHALGLSHEHQHPEAEFDWNVPAIVSDHLNLDWAECGTGDRVACERSVRAHITNRVTDPEIMSQEVDLSSIMIYPIRRHWLNSGEAVAEPTVISATDFAVIRRMYE